MAALFSAGQNPTKRLEVVGLILGNKETDSWARDHAGKTAYDHAIGYGMMEESELIKR